MKIALISLAFGIAFTASTQASYSVNLSDLQNEAICQSNAAVFYPECQADKRTDIICDVQLTEEATARTERMQFAIGANDRYSKQGDDRLYQVNDGSDSTTIFLNEKTGRGSITIHDGSKVLYSGHMTCK